MKRVRIAVIGVGHLGRFHAAKLALLPDAELVAVVDILPERAQEVARRLGVQAFSDFRQVLPQVDAVSVVVPTVHHYQVAKEALEAGCHVFVEKPLAASPEEARELVRLAQKLDRILQVGHIERFNPAIKRLLSETKSPVFIEAERISRFSDRCLDVDVILDLMIHDLDLVLTIMRQKIAELQATGAPVMTDKTDLASVRLVFENGTVANLTASRLALKPRRSFRVFQAGMYLAADTLENTFLKVKLMDSGAEEGPSEAETFPNPDPLLEELTSFVQAVASGQRPPVSGEEGFEALELAFRIKKEIEKQMAHFLAREGSCLPDLKRHCVS